MPVNSIAENVLGTIGMLPYDFWRSLTIYTVTGTILWTGQLAPQVWKSWREKSTSGLSPWLVFVSQLTFGRRTDASTPV
jgi:hypothetical protein